MGGSKWSRGRRRVSVLVAIVLLAAACESLPDTSHNGGQLLSVPIEVVPTLTLLAPPVSAGAGRTWVINRVQPGGSVAVHRLLADGSIDRSIGTDGAVRPPGLGISDRFVMDAVATPDGGFVFAHPSGPNNLSSTIYKASSSGQVVSNYGGIFAVDRGVPGGLAVDAAGGVIVGNVINGAFHTVRIAPNGTQDKTYGSDGVLPWPNAVAFGGFAVAAGGHASPSGADVAWITPTGETATTWPGIGAVGHVAADDLGRVVASGAADGGTVPIARLGADRALDPTFGIEGIALAPEPAPGVTLRAVIPLADHSTALSWSLDSPRTVLVTRLTAAAG